MREAKQAAPISKASSHNSKSPKRTFQQKLLEVDQQLFAAAKQWDAAIDANASDTDRDAIKVRLNELLNRRSYIRNLVNSVAKELA